MHASSVQLRRSVRVLGDLEVRRTVDGKRVECDVRERRQAGKVAS